MCDQTQRVSVLTTLVCVRLLSACGGSHTQMVDLLSSLEGTPLDARQRYFASLQSGRRRDRFSAAGTPLFDVFHHETAKNMRRLMLMAARFREAIRVTAGSLDKAFREFDANGDGFLDAAELETVRWHQQPPPPPPPPPLHTHCLVCVHDHALGPELPAMLTTVCVPLYLGVCMCVRCSCNCTWPVLAFCPAFVLLLFGAVHFPPHRPCTRWMLASRRPRSESW